MKNIIDLDTLMEAAGYSDYDVNLAIFKGFQELKPNGEIAKDLFNELVQHSDINSRIIYHKEIMQELLEIITYFNSGEFFVELKERQEEDKAERFYESEIKFF